jgi:hypothetical protein
VTTRTITGPHFITTAPSPIDCPSCRRPILAATVGGLDRHVDPTPLNPAGELAALLTGRATYDLAGARRDHLIRRNVHRIGAATGLPVLADHTCTPPTPGHVDQARLEAAEGPVVAADDRPPF